MTVNDPVADDLSALDPIDRYRALRRSGMLRPDSLSPSAIADIRGHERHGAVAIRNGENGKFDALGAVVRI